MQKNVRRGILQCFINFGYRKTLCIRGVNHDFLWEFFCLTVPKTSYGNLSAIGKFSGEDG